MFLLPLLRSREDSSRPMQDIGNLRCLFSPPLVTHCSVASVSIPCNGPGVLSQWWISLSRTVSSFCSPPPLPSQYSSLVDHGTYSFLLQLTGQHLTQRWPSHKCTRLHAVFFLLPLGLLHSSQSACCRVTVPGTNH